MKQYARRKVRWALEKGLLTRSDRCEMCGVLDYKRSDGRSVIQGHHPDHSKPLEVQWLCAKCHKSITYVDYSKVSRALWGTTWSDERKAAHSEAMKAAFAKTPKKAPTGRPWLELGISRRTWYRRKNHAPR